MYFDQLLGAAPHPKAGQTTLFCSFSDVFSWFQAWNHWKGLKWTKKDESGWIKVVLPAFGWAQHPKAGGNTQHMGIPITRDSFVQSKQKYKVHTLKA